ncbi:iron-containing alcohol dehydrogenase [Clostridium fungisolvens]|uniref:Aldehyde-alcohol dehydrogenase n=1 Tax=Clostridium fungisolvens TaxID=1604897 RepID=A0A6V8SK23_9CLOT|nr:iron-containing alcohol dehydrogenase [Clostridium fungisolvens]GFP77579.1 Aldehyde-alcohol dehydrogenase [Clostridium fungisolvens]
MSRFTLPRDIYYGKGTMEQLKELEGKRAVIVTGGGSMRKFGFLDKAISYLKDANFEVNLIEGVEPDPSVETVIDGSKKMLEYRPDWIVAIGGGSAIDAAKAMWVFYEYPDENFENIKKPFSIPKLRNKAKFVAIPSTSGTATEVTAFTVITDYKTKIKYPLADYDITPDIAIVDSELAETMPAKLTAHTGMDALTHGIEAYVASQHTCFTDPLALQSIEMVRDNLLNSYQGDKEARERMHYAQCLAGMAFSNALLGITHSMAHKTGAIFNIPHGCANAIYLPYVIDYNKKTCSKRYADISRRLQLQGETDDELVESLRQLIRLFNEKLGIPNSLKEYGVKEDVFNSNLQLIAENAVEDACTGSNPRKITKVEMEKLFVCSFHGTKVFI